MTYDPDRFDIEILLDRMRLSPPFNAEAMCQIFKCGRTTFQRARKEGRVPDPFVMGDCESPSLWSHEQVIDMLMRSSTIFRPPRPRKKAVYTRPRKPPPLKPFVHGTHAGYDMHRNRGVPMCDACREARNEYKRQWKKRKSEAAA